MSLSDVHFRNLVSSEAGLIMSLLEDYISKAENDIKKSKNHKNISDLLNQRLKEVKQFYEKFKKEFEI